jgi:hypothetical protein
LDGGRGPGEDVGGRQVEQHTREEPEIQPEKLMRDGEQQRAGGTGDRATASATSSKRARRRLFPDRAVMV